MVSRKGKAIIGLFVLGAIALVCFSVILLGSGSYNYEKRSFVLFFNSTLRGLTVGSPVYYNGVRVGKVTSMHISTVNNQVAFDTPVIIEIEQIPSIGNSQSMPDLVEYLSDEEIVRTLIKNGLRAKLSTLSFITGLLVVDLAMEPNAPPVDPDSLKPFHGIPQLPTIPSGLDSLLSDFSNIPIEPLSEKTLDLLTNVTKITENVKDSDIIEQLTKTLKTLDNTLLEYQKLAENINKNLESTINNTLLEYQKLAENVNHHFDDTIGAFNESLDHSTKTIQSINTIAEKVSALLNTNSSLMQQLFLTMSSFQDAANSITSLARTLQRNPEAIIFGK